MLRVSLLLQQANAGWSESWYLDTPFEQGLLSAQALATVRRPTLGSLVTIGGVRVSEVDPVGLASVRLLNYAGTHAAQADTPFQSLIVYLRTADARKRTLLLRGIPDVPIVNGVFQGSTAFNAALQLLMEHLIANAYSIRMVKRANPLLKIRSISTLGVLTTFTPHGLVADNEVQLFRTKDTDGFDVSGRYRVAAAPSATTVELANWNPASTVSSGQARKFEYEYIPIKFWEPINRIVSRKVGRPFGSPAGRVSRRNKRPA